MGCILSCCQSIGEFEKMNEADLFSNQNSIMVKIADFQMILDQIQKTKILIKNPNANISVTNWQSTTYHNTVCVEHLTLCHESCRLNYNPNNGSGFFNDCGCMDSNKRCRVCGCISEKMCIEWKNLLSSRLHLKAC